MEKMRIAILRREHWTRAPDHWYGHFGSKLCFWKVVKKCQNYQNWFNLGSKPCAWPLGYGGWLDASKPLVLAGAVPFGVLFLGKKGVWKSNNAYLLKNRCIIARRTIIAVSRRKIIAVSRRQIIAIYSIKEYGPYGPRGLGPIKQSSFKKPFSSGLQVSKRQFGILDM